VWFLRDSLCAVEQEAPETHGGARYVRVYGGGLRGYKGMHVALSCKVIVDGVSRGGRYVLLLRCLQEERNSMDTVYTCIRAWLLNSQIYNHLTFRYSCMYLLV
jgi:hypothetical protein